MVERADRDNRGEGSIDLPQAIVASAEADPAAAPLWAVAPGDYQAWLAGRDDAARRWLEAIGYKPEAGRHALLPATDGALAGVVLGLGDTPDLWCFGALATTLPAGDYRLETSHEEALGNDALLGWSLGAYRFERYKSAEGDVARLIAPDNSDLARAEWLAHGIGLARDLINTPAADMAPADLAEVAQGLAGDHGAQCRVLVGDDLLLENYPAIHAVGRASINRPRLIDLIWGEAEQPLVTLVGKGVCFDSGGLDLKSASAMLKMKKDMGGAATVLGLASAIMAAQLPVRLRVLIPAVENAVSASAYRPGDVLQTRKGLTVEVGNTDAEGRIVLADALAEADSERPELLIDCATLTGAARVALGPDLPALFTPDDDLAASLLAAGVAETDPLWRMPLHGGYRDWLDSDIADLNNVSGGPFAGAVVAALFLREFVTETKAHAHIDTYAWNEKSRPGRPRGGEALGLRALFAYLAGRYRGADA